MSEGILDDRRKALEESFFRKTETETIEKFKAAQNQKNKAEALRKVSEIEDEKVLNEMVTQGISPETFAALSLTPLVKVAWADGKIQKEERDAILDAAQKGGIQKDSPSWVMLNSWLEVKPNDDLFETWHDYIQSLISKLDDEHILGLKLAVLGKSRKVADSAGGFLGLGSKISKEEEEAIQSLEKAFSK